MSEPRREDPEAARARRGRNIAIAVGLVAFVIIVYVVTVVRLGASVATRSF
jgi:t-SNARE complex subunit (syntaxin)